MVTVVGWAAAVVVLAAYWLVTDGRVAATSLPYLGLNAAGATGLAISAAAAHAWPSAAVNVIWLGIGLTPLVKAWRRAAPERVNPEFSTPERV